MPGASDAVITVVVTTHQGHPIAGADVRAGKSVVTTDANGQATITRVAGSAAVSHPDYVQTEVAPGPGKTAYASILSIIIISYM